MKMQTNSAIRLLCLALAWTATGAGGAQTTSAAIPAWEIGAKATAQAHGDALGVTATTKGARLRCGFQKLEARATSEGLWLESNAPEAAGKIRLVATAVGREPAGTGLLARTGKVQVVDGLVRFDRPGLTEEYSVSVDGVRQDFVIAEQRAGSGDLCVELALAGARAEAAAYGAKLRLNDSGRELAYSRLRATDATGQELKARLEVVAPDRLAVRVADANATYPVRIDPTFSDADWVSMNPGLLGTDKNVFALATDANGNLYVGGDFTIAGSVFATNIAKWNGSAWSALGSGVNGRVNALVISGTNLYAGGIFTNAGVVTTRYIAQWNGSAWSALGTGMGGVGPAPFFDPPNVHALAVVGPNLYAGGYFITAGGVTANCIAKCDGKAWSALGEGIGPMDFEPSVNALVVSGTNLYAGGEFGLAGGSNAFYIAKWDGSGWSALGEGVNSTVNALAVSGTNLYAGGYFTTAGGVSANYIAQWDGNTWSALGPGMVGSSGGNVRVLAVSGTNLYAGGEFTTAGAVTANYIARWDGTTWSSLGEGMSGYVNALAMIGTNLYAGGEFFATAQYIAKWDGSVWSALGSAINPYGYVNALVVSGSDLYVGGAFTTVGGVSANSVAKWNGSTWSALGSGVSSPVNALATSGTNLYAGGYFTTAGGLAANSIAKWDGNNWSALGSGMGGGLYAGYAPQVTALAVSGTTLYAGGWFTTAGGVPAKLIAKWNGSAWSALGSGMNNVVSALAVNGTTLYAGGYFTTAGTVTANLVAKWNGSSWSALSSGIGGQSPFVDALAVSGTTLYAGGYFTTAGGASAKYIAKWNGSTWSPLGSGMGGLTSPYVATLAMSETNLYVGGDFTTAGGVSANYIAKWNGITWSPLGSGMGGSGLAQVATVMALAADESGHLFVGGAFSVAGTNVSPYLAQANIAVRVNGGRIGSPVFSPVTGLSCTFDNATIGQFYRIQTSPSLEVGSWAELTNFTYTGPVQVIDASAVAAPMKFYRVVTP